VSAAPVVYACVNRLEPSITPAISETAPNATNAETVRVEIDSHVGAEPEADHKVIMSARVKNVTQADSMETNVAEPPAVPKKKMRLSDSADMTDVEIGSAIENAEPSVGAPEGCNEEAWTNMTYKQRKRWRRRNK